MRKITIAVADEQAERLIRITNKSGGTMEQAIGQALQLYEGCLDVLDVGGRIISIDRHGLRNDIMTETAK